MYVLYEARTDCYVDRVIFQPLGAVPATAARVFVSEVNPQGGWHLNRETTVPVVAAASEVAGIASTPLTLDLYLAAGQKVAVTVGTLPTDGIDASLVVLDVASMWTYIEK